MDTVRQDPDVERINHFTPGDFVTPGHTTRTRWVVLAVSETKGLRIAPLDDVSEPFWTWSRSVFKEMPHG